MSFPAKLNVNIGGVKAIGQNMNKKNTVEKPLIKWNTEPDTYYTVICVDPDSTAKSWLHWLVANCDIGNPESGEELVKWSPPAPAVGVHTYYFCLFSHAYKISPEVPSQRGYFNIAEFSKINGLNPLRVATIRVSSK